MSKIIENLKNLLDNISQEEFDKQWNEVTAKNKKKRDANYSISLQFIQDQAKKNTSSFQEELAFIDGAIFIYKILTKKK